MKHKNSLFTIITVVMVASMVLAACAPAATATTAPAAPTTAPLSPTTAPTAMPVPPTAVPPTAVPATAAPTVAPTAAGPTKGGTIVVSNAAGNYYTLDEFVSPWHDYADYAMYDTILTSKLDFTGYVGDLVTDQWEVSADNLTVTFHVKPGLKFHDGTPVDAAALKWNLDHWIDPKVAAPGGGNLQSAVKSVDAPDASTLVIHLLAPYAPL